MTVSNNLYKNIIRTEEDKKKYKIDPENNITYLSELFDIPKKLLEAFYLTDEVSLKSVISDITNIKIGSKLTGNDDIKVENIWSNFSDGAEAFTKLENMKRRDIDSKTRMKLVTIISF